LVCTGYASHDWKVEIIPDTTDNHYYTGSKIEYKVIESGCTTNTGTFSASDTNRNAASGTDTTQGCGCGGTCLWLRTKGKDYYTMKEAKATKVNAAGATYGDTLTFKNFDHTRLSMDVIRPTKSYHDGGISEMTLCSEVDSHNWKVEIFPNTTDSHYHTTNTIKYKITESGCTTDTEALPATATAKNVPVGTVTTQGGTCGGVCISFTTDGTNYYTLLKAEATKVNAAGATYGDTLTFENKDNKRLSKDVARPALGSSGSHQDGGVSVLTMCTEE